MEIFKDIEGYEGYYQISNTGRAKSLKRTIKVILGSHKLHRVRERILKPAKRDGYSYIVLCKGGKTKSFSIHKLIALAFIENPKNYLQVDHIDRNKTNNSIDNLRWVSRSVNLRNSAKCDNASSKYNGVSWDKENKKWLACCYIRSKVNHLGRFLHEVNAAKSFDNYCIQNNLDRELNDVQGG